MSIEKITPEKPKAAWLTISKTSPPKMPDHLVRRDSLLLKLGEALHCQTSHLVAPAGYGKTTLLSQWCSELVTQNIACAWINLEANDGEICNFFSYLVIALNRAGIDTGSLSVRAEQRFQGMSEASIGTELLSVFENLNQKLVIVLDDYHAILSPKVEEFLCAAQICGSEKLHIAFASRENIGSNSPAIFASGNVVVIEARELKFSDREVLLALGEEVDQETLAALQEKAEGWPFAIQMARISAQSGGIKSAISSLCGHHGHIGDYLIHQVVRNLPKNLFNFVIKTSLLDKFNLELADEICGSGDSLGAIANLGMMDSFLVPLDDKREWFRYHHLFSECLRNFGKQNEVIDVDAAYRSAIGWFERHGLIAEAVRYANLIEDYVLSGEIVKRNGGWAIALSFGTDQLKQIISTIPESEIQKDPRLMLANAYLFLVAGELRKAQTYCNSADLLIGDEAIAPDVELDRLCVSSAIASRAESQNEPAGRWFESRLERAKTHGSFCQGYIEALLANDLLMRGDFSGSKRHAENAYLQLQSGTNSIDASYAHLPIATGAFYKGDFDEARRQYSLAGRLAENPHGSQSDVKNLVGIAVQAIDYWEGGFKNNEPVELYHELDSIFQTDGNFDSFVIGTDALFHHAISTKNLQEAQRLIDTLFLANMRYGIKRVEKYCDILQLELCLYRGQLAKAEIHFSKIRKWHSPKEDNHEENYWFLNIMAGYARAQFLAAIGYTEEAINQIDSAIEIGEEFEVAPLCVRGHVLKASIFNSIRDVSNAKNCLQTALTIAAPIQMRRMFTDAYLPSQLLGMVRQEINESNHSPLLKEFAEQIYLASQDGILSDRERDVLIGISNGMTNKEIARMLDLTESTIKFHQRKLYKKFGVTKRVNAVSKARELNMLM